VQVHEVCSFHCLGSACLWPSQGGCGSSLPAKTKCVGRGLDVMPITVANPPSMLPRWPPELTGGATPYNT
jgi:hypothetical protein